MSFNRDQRGDTLIELMIAIAILSMAIVIAVTSMGYGLSLALTTGERTAVRGELNSQLAFVRFARDAYITNENSAGGQLWQDLVSRVDPATSNEGTVCDLANGRPYNQPNMFYIETSDALAANSGSLLVNSVNNYPYTDGINPDMATGQAVPGKGMWLIARSDNPSEYIDFYSKACWSPPTRGPAQQLSTVLRMYTP